MLIFSLFLFFAVTEADRRKLRDCIRPWQAPLMSISTISNPARPLQCLQENSTCPKGRNSACQFSLKSFKYICCQDKSDVEPPVCPKFHDTLLMTCGSENDASCPTGYDCLPSRYDKSVNLCCKLNDDLTYLEPETTFRDNKIVPQILKKSPPFETEVMFKNETLVLGQLYVPSILTTLALPPNLFIKNATDEYLYSVFLLDSTNKRLNWLVVNVQHDSGRLLIDKGSRVAVDYVAPSEEDKPLGFHILVLAIFEQNKKWDNRELSSIAFDNFDFTSLNNLKSISADPISASFYGYSTVEDDRI